MGRRSITGGVMPAGPTRIRFDFSIEGHRFRPTLPWTPNETNLRRARIYLARKKHRSLRALSVSLTSSPSTEEFGDSHLPSERGPVARYSTTLSVTRKLALREVISPR